MSTAHRLGRTLGLVLVCLTSTAMAQQDWCFATATTAATQQVSVYNLPNGQGRPLTQAKAFGSSAPVDATITLTLLNDSGDPIVGVPAEDLWLETTLSGMVLCPGGSTADAPTDDDGRTTWSRSLRAGGGSDRQAGEKTLVVIGWPHTFYQWCSPPQPSPLDILFNSPDISGDLVVNITDTVLFSQNYSGTYNYRADFYFDGVINLSDTIWYAQGIGASCP